MPHLFQAGTIAHRRQIRATKARNALRSDLGKVVRKVMRRQNKPNFAKNYRSIRVQNGTHMFNCLHYMAAIRESYIRFLLMGDQIAARSLIAWAMDDGCGPHKLLKKLIWPAMEYMEPKFEAESIDFAEVETAMIANADLARQLTVLLPRMQSNGKSVVILCGSNAPAGLGGRICADMLEARGYRTRLEKGGLPFDDLLRVIREIHPHLLVLCCTLSSELPTVRKLIDYIREPEIGFDVQIICCGGIYTRNKGLGFELGADLSVPDAGTAVVLAEARPEKRATRDQISAGRLRRKRRREDTMNRPI